MHAHQMRSRTGEALTGRIAVGMERLSGNVTSVQGDRVTLFVPGRIQAKIGIGSTPSLHLRVGNQPEASFAAQLVRRSDEAQGVTLILKLVRPWEVQDKLARLLSNFFGRRQHLRIKPDPRHGLTLKILTDTPWTATVMDLSEGGMAFSVQASFEPAELLVEMLPLQLRTLGGRPYPCKK